MSEPDVTFSFARTLVDEWARAGIGEAVVSPGSRNTPLVLALARDGRFEVDVVLDERSAGFRALGIGRASGRPAIVCCTSGTAAANLHPAVVEAHHGRVPLIVCTADRPPELRDCGAGQTINQTNLYGRAVRWFHDPGPPALTADADARWRTLAARAVTHAVGRPAGPVHLNLPFREPLVPTGAPLVDTPGRAAGEPWVRTTRAPRAPALDDVARLVELVRAHGRGVLVAGWGAEVAPATAARFSAASGWPVLADPLSQLRTGAGAISTYEALLRTPVFARSHEPEVVVRVGAPLTSKIANAWLDAARVPTVLVDGDDTWLDPGRSATERIVADANPTLDALAGRLTDATEPAWTNAWRAAERAARRALDHVLDDDIACEARIARDVAAAIPAGGSLVVASSLPVRALEWAMAPRADLRVLANRGANGIDGFVSTALGVARAQRAQRAHEAVTVATTVAMCGDLCFLHDVNGLLTTGSSTPVTPVTFVVVDNGGGGIFSYLPQHELAEFERFFNTPQDVDLVAVAEAHGVTARRIEHVGKLADEIAGGTDESRVLVVPVNRDAALDQHRRVWDAVATALA